jgi:hypothetical protein
MQKRFAQSCAVCIALLSVVAASCSTSTDETVRAAASDDRSGPATPEVREPSTTVGEMPDSAASSTIVETTISPTPDVDLPHVKVELTSGSQASVFLPTELSGPYEGYLAVVPEQASVRPPGLSIQPPSAKECFDRDCYSIVGSPATMDGYTWEPQGVGEEINGRTFYFPADMCAPDGEAAVANNFVMWSEAGFVYTIIGSRAPGCEGSFATLDDFKQLVASLRPFTLSKDGLVAVE